MSGSLLTYLHLHAFVDAPLWIILLLKTTAILAVAWFAHICLARVNPRWRVFLWRLTTVTLVMLVVVSLAVPAIQIPVAPVPVAPELALAPATLSVPPGEWNSPGRTAPGRHDSSRPEPEIAPEVIATESPSIAIASAFASPVPLSPSSLSRVTAPALLLTLWLSGIAILIFRLSIGYSRIWAIVRRARPASDGIHDECRRVAQAIDCGKRVTVLQTTGIQSPLLCGIVRPRVLLPERMCNESYRHDLTGILAHELTHLRSRDIHWNVVLQLISIVLWFHPLAWWIRKAHLAACELVCDAVSATLVGNVDNYCRTLARVAVDAWTVAPEPGIAMARTSAITRRLNALKTRVFHLPLRYQYVISLAIASLLTAATFGALQLAFAEPLTPEEPAPAPSQPDPAPPNESIRVRVLDPDGNPLPDAEVQASIWTKQKRFQKNRKYKTDANGVAPVELPRTYAIVRLWARKKPFVTMFSHWEKNELAGGGKLPDEYTISLERAVTASGRIIDAEGKPVAGVTIEVMADGGKPIKGDHRTGYNTWLAEEEDALATDAEGRWQINNVPDNPDVELKIKVSHPDYLCDERWGQFQKQAGITTDMLRNGTAVLKLCAGLFAAGRVTNAEGKPIEGALVVRVTDALVSTAGGLLSYGRVPGGARTGSRGRYKLGPLHAQDTKLAVIAPDYVPQFREVRIEADMPPQDFQLVPGKPIEIRVVDTNERPIPGVSIQVGRVLDQSWIHDTESEDGLATIIPAKTDEKGTWRWTGAPSGPVKLAAYRDGFAAQQIEINGGDLPQRITLKPEHRITGTVTDAQSGEPIPTFAVIPVDVFRNDYLNAERGNAETRTDGRLEFLATRTDIPLRLRIEARGYRAQDGPEFRVGDDAFRTQNFSLQPSPPVTGLILDQEGTPAANAEVLMATPTNAVDLNSDWSNNKVSTDDAGRFEFPDPGEPFVFFARTETGAATSAQFPVDSHDAGTLRLQPWASVRGRFIDGGEPVPDAWVMLQPISIRHLDRPRIDAIIQVRTDADGRFEFPRALPGPCRALVNLGPWRDPGFRSGPSMPLDLQPGQHFELDLGSGGAVVHGKVTPTGSVPADLDCTYSLNHLIRREPGISPPPEIAAAGFDVRNGWRDTWRKTQEGSAYLNTLQHWFVKLAPDGSFRISGVPPGDYDLAIELYAKPTGCLVDPLARKVVQVSVSDTDAASGELTLPEIPLEITPFPVVGDTPTMTFQRADGSAGSLEDFRGQHTLLHFWASWCAPCKKQMPTLQQLHKQFAPRGLVMLGLSLDENSPAWQAALGRHELPWPQGRLHGAQPGVSTVPAYWLLDPDGKIVAKNQTADELAGMIAEELQ